MLSAEEHERPSRHLQLGKALYASGEALRQASFPWESLVSTRSLMESSASAEIWVVTNVGHNGIALFVGRGSTAGRASVRSAGHATRPVGRRRKDESHRDGRMQLPLLRYTQDLIAVRGS